MIKTTQNDIDNYIDTLTNTITSTITEKVPTNSIKRNSIGLPIEFGERQKRRLAKDQNTAVQEKR